VTLGAGPESGFPVPPEHRSGAERKRELEIHSWYDQLSPEEDRRVASEPPFNSVVEGRLVDGSYWRLSAYERPTGEIRTERRQISPNGTGGGGCSDYKRTTQWAWGLGGRGTRYMSLDGFAYLEAETIRLVAKDARTATVPGAFRPDMGVSFFLAYVECGGPDWERLEARDGTGAVLSTYEFDYLDVGMPSWVCEQNAKAGQ